MSVIVAFMSVVVRMPMAVMGMSERCESDDVNEEPKYTDDEKLVEALQLVTFP
jgi:hypothetical protein